MTIEELEARVERLESILGTAPVGAAVALKPTYEELLAFYRQYKGWLVEAYEVLRASRLRGRTK